MTVRPCYQLLAVDDNQGDMELLRMHLAGIPDWQADVHGFSDPRDASNGSSTIPWT